MGFQLRLLKQENDSGDSLKEKKVLFICPAPSSFIIKDIKILKKNFNVHVFKWDVTIDNKFAKIINIIKLAKEIFFVDIIFGWFLLDYAAYAAFFSKLFGKKTVIIVGGFDVACVQEINYGMMLNPKHINIARYALENCEKILTVDDGLKWDAIKNTGVMGNNIITVPTGYEYEIFIPKLEKENLVLTVCMGNDWARVRLKGLDTFVESAKFIPETTFLIVGIQGEALEKLESLKSSNVMFMDPLPEEALIPYYQKAKVYCQLSMREGLPNALCEAMLCECVPVGTDVQGVRTAIGDAGFYVPYGDPKATAEAINMAMNSDKGKDARERIKNMFPASKREESLKKIIRELI